MTIRDKNSAQQSVYWDLVQITRSTRTGDIVVTVEAPTKLFERVYSKADNFNPTSVSIDMVQHMASLAEIVPEVVKYKIEDYLANEKSDFKL